MKANRAAPRERAIKGNPRTSPAPQVKQFQALLRDSGLRSTAPRLAVLAYFHEHGGRNSHAELFATLEDRGFDRATIYRILTDLAAAKILSRSDLGDHVWRFELRKGVGGAEHGHDHPHFVCVDCGEISCLHGVQVKLQGHAKAPKSVANNEVAVQLKGVCDPCDRGSRAATIRRPTPRLAT